MSTNKLTETLDSLSDKAFGFKDKSPESNTAPHDIAPTAHYENQKEYGDQAEALADSHATAEYPPVEHPTEQFADEPTTAYQAEPHFPENSFPVGVEHAVSPDSYPQRPLNPPTQHHHTQEQKLVLKNGPEQDFTVATVAGFMGVLSILLMFGNAVTGLLAIIFGATAVYFARKTERAGIGAGIGKTLGWFSFFGGIVALIAAAFFLFVAFVYVMMR
jgi:hypothetical protein